MKKLSRWHPPAERTTTWGRVLCAVTIALFSTAAAAAPITYTGFTITDGKLGSWEFHNARVYLSFQSDTKYVQFMQFPFVPSDPNCLDPTNPPPCTVDVNVNQTGTAAVTIISDGKAVHATFAPNQVLVSFDLGDTPAFQTGRGVGFSSFSATAPGGIEPTYPLGLEDGTLHRVDIVDNFSSPELVAMSVDLQHDAVFSGRAWPCVGFPNDCAPPNALATDKGDFYLYLPYWLGTGAANQLSGTPGDSLSAGFFVAEVGESEDETSPMTVRAARSGRFEKPITYDGYVLSDVTLSEKNYQGAQVYLPFAADVSTAVPFKNGPPNSFINATGDARVTIISHGHVVSADFDPGQIYVYYDEGNASVGFGSTAGNSGYPLTITDKSVTTSLAHILDGNSLVGAVSHIALNPKDASNYSKDTASLVTDLTNATTLSGPASSCGAFDPATSYCPMPSILMPIAFKTNRGNFYLFEPYTVDEMGNGEATFSPNWGVFWSELGRAENDN